MASTTVNRTLGPTVGYCQEIPFFVVVRFQPHPVSVGHYDCSETVGDDVNVVEAEIPETQQRREDCTASDRITLYVTRSQRVSVGKFCTQASSYTRHKKYNITLHACIHLSLYTVDT